MKHLIHKQNVIIIVVQFSVKLLKVIKVHRFQVKIHVMVITILGSLPRIIV